MTNQDSDSETETAPNPFSSLLPNSSPHDQNHQDHLQHHYIASIKSTVVIRQLKSLGLSFQLWPAATSLVNLLSSLFPRRDSLRILEIGSGTGLVGIAAAAVLSADVTITDLPHVMENLQFNADANMDLVESRRGKVHVAALSWGNKDEMESIGRDYDLILGSDVVYHDHLYEPLLCTLRYLMEGEREKVFVMGHLKRWKKESVFFKKARKLFEVEVIHRDDPPDGCRIGVVVYRFRSKKVKNAELTTAS